jgi:hypothetical protein
MLIANGIRLASSNPMRTMGGASAFNIERSNYGKNGAMNNFYAGDATVEAGASIANKSAFPVGYVHPYSWHPAMKSGGMACRVVAGTGEVTTANGANGYNIDADLTGTGDVTQAIGALIVSAVASLTGSADVTASMAGIIQAAASLTGSGDVAAAIGAIVEMIAGLSGEGSVSAESTAKGSMASEITVTGDLLSTANVGDAVWSTLLEAGFTASQIVRIVAAATAGASSGGPSSPVFRNLGDTDDMISGTADSNGNRSSITYGE